MPEQDIARYKHIFDEILRMTDDGFIVVDTNGIVTDINDQYCDFLGKPKEEIVGYPIQKTISNSKMVDIVKRRYSEELALHKFLPGQSKENDNNFLLVSRSCVCDEEDRVVAGVAQVKFRLQTLDSAKRLMSEYAELEFYKEEYHKTGGCRASFDSIVGSTEAFLEKKRLGLKAARTDFPVLLTGETGTGKEVFARSIHSASSRADKPMVSINCAAIPNELLESELFGYVDGAFTGARKGGKPGKFQLANGGTLFLDEIGDMPLHMQAKILRALQEREVEPVGGAGPVAVDVRVISATRRNLPALIEAGAFREDLYYRLNVINIEMLPLRCRRADILELANFFLARLNKEFQRATVLSPEVKHCFASYQWPGNIRELDNVIKGAYATCDGFTIDMRDLPGKMSQPRGPAVPGAGSGKQLAELMNDYEREIILAVLRDKGGNCQRAAEELGIHRSALYKKMAKLGIDPAADCRGRKR